MNNDFFTGTIICHKDIKASCPCILFLFLFWHHVKFHAEKKERREERWQRKFSLCPASLREINFFNNLIWFLLLSAGLKCVNSTLIFHCIITSIQSTTCIPPEGFYSAGQCFFGSKSYPIVHRRFM